MTIGRLVVCATVLLAGFVPGVAAQSAAEKRTIDNKNVGCRRECEELYWASPIERLAGFLRQTV